MILIQKELFNIFLKLGKSFDLLSFSRILESFVTFYSADPPPSPQPMFNLFYALIGLIKN